MSKTIERVSISPTMPEGTRLLGSIGIPLRRHDDAAIDLDGVLDPIRVSVPDVGIQVVPCLENAPGVPEGIDLEAEVIAAARESFGATADVRYACINGRGHIGVWMSTAASQEVVKAREEGLVSLDLLKGNELYGIFINSAFIRRGREGSPPPAGTGGIEAGGPVHLTSMKILFKAPDTVTTRVEGYDERPWPDVSFTYDLIDKISASGDGIQVVSTEDLDVDRSWVTYLVGALVGIGGFFHPAVWFFGGVPFLLQELAIRGKRPPGRKGAAGAAAAALLPGEILIRGGIKVVALYSRAEVSEGGLFAGGSIVVLDREPVVGIDGPSGIAVGPGENDASGEFHVRRGDLRAPLTIVWESDGLVLEPNRVNTTIGFSIPENRQFIDRNVSVTVRDADGLSAQDSMTVRLRRVLHDPSLPPVCRVKPWLPQCNP